MKNNTKKLTLLGVLAAMSTLLYLLPGLPILPAFPWLKIDFADFPALLASVMVSPIAGGVIVLIRNTIHLLASDTGMVGELSNFLISFVFVTSTGLMSRVFKTNRAKFDVPKIIMSLIVGAVCQIITAMLVNYYIMMPLYGLQIAADYYIFMGVLPFNAIKDFISCVIFVMVGLVIHPAIKRFLKIST